MSHYEERLQHDLDAIKASVIEVGGQVERAVQDAVGAVLHVDENLAARTILGDHPINREVRAIDRRCHAFVARHLPSAGILRFVSSVLRLGIALERVGDYAVSISRQAVQLSEPPPDVVVRDLEGMGEHAHRTLVQALEAFHSQNVELARVTKDSARQVSVSSTRTFEDLTREGEAGSRPLHDLFGLLLVFNRLERVCDQAKNICEEAVFVATGETKQPKVYNVLFLDGKNDCASQVAALVARKAFPESGDYASAGWDPAERVDASVTEFMDGAGYDARDLVPSLVGQGTDDLARFHVIVALEPGARQRLDHVPFSTVLVEWELAETDLESLHRALSSRVHELMVVLRGEDAG